MSDPLSPDDVRHVARLARLDLTESEIDACRADLAAILEHVAMLEQVDVDGVEPLAHPVDMVNRLDDDEPGPVFDVETVLANAPATEGDCIAVPKVLGDGGGA